MENRLSESDASDSLQIDLKTLEEEEIDYIVQALEEKPGISRNSVVDRLLDELSTTKKFNFRDAKSNMKRLICSEILSFNLYKVMHAFPSNPESALEVLKMISSQARSIIVFTINVPNGVECDNFPKMESEMLQEIVKMTNLQRLEINRFHLNIDQVILMCSELNSLTTIAIKLYPPKMIILEDFIQTCQISFGHVRTFLFSTSFFSKDRSIVVQNFLTNFFLRYLPNLEYVGDPSFFTTLDLNILQGMQICQLRHLSLRLKNDLQIHTIALLPLLESISIKFESNDIDMGDILMSPLLDIPRLKNLKLVNLHSPIFLEMLLDTYRHKLKLLVVAYDTATMVNVHFDYFRSCSNLKLLKLHNILRMPEDSASWSTASFGTLEELVLTTPNSEADISLFNILLAPKLEVVKLIGFSVQKADFLETARFIEEQKMLKALEELTLDVKLSEYANQKDLKELECRLVEALLKLCPNDRNHTNKIDIKLSF